MNDLSIAKFDPLKAEIAALADNVRSVVASSSGAEGYDLMKENKKTLQSRRVDLVRDLKAERDGAIKFQKAIVAVENECLKLIADVETPLDEKIKEVDDARKREERLAILPERKEKLASIELEMTDDEVLDMDDKVFAQFFVDKKMAYLEEKQAKIDAENKRLDDERQAQEAEKKRQEDLTKAREEAAENAKREADEEKKRAVQREKDKAEKARQKLIDDQARKDQERIDAENKVKQDEADKAAKEQAENDRLEKMKKYQKFLTDNGWTKETDSEFHIKRGETKVVLYKKVGEFKI